MDDEDRADDEPRDDSPSGEESSDETPPPEGEPSDGDPPPEEGPPPEADEWDDLPSDAGETAQDSGERQCQSCGATLSRHSKFCTECGTRQDGTDIDTGAGGGPHAGGDQRDWGEQEYGGREQEYGGREQEYGAQQRQAAQPGHGGRQHGQPDRLHTAGPDSDTGLAAISHVLALFLGILGPILIYIVTDDPFVKQNAANATNWQIMLIIYSIISVVLILLLIGILLVFALIIMNLAFIIIAAIKASDGEAWEYPLTPELL